MPSEDEACTDNPQDTYSEQECQAYLAGYNAALNQAEAAVAADDMPPCWWKSMFFGGRRARYWCQYGWEWKQRDAIAAIRALKEQ